MKPISIGMQRIIALIPGLNLLCLPIFLYNSLVAKFSFKDYLRSWVFYLFPAVLLAVLCELIVPFLPTAGVLVGHAFNYVICLLVGYRLAAFQERYF